MCEKLELTHRRALIIGADGGAGRVIAVRLAQEGMKLALAGRGAEELMRTAALTGRPLDMLVLPADVAEKRGQDDILHILEGHFKGLDALVNSAGAPARALCGRALPLLRASERPVMLDVGREAAPCVADADGIRVEALVCGESEEALRALAERTVRIIRGDE